MVLVFLGGFIGFRAPNCWGLGLRVDQCHGAPVIKHSPEHPFKQQQRHLLNK